MNPLELDILIPSGVRVQIIVGETHLVDLKAPVDSILIYSIVFPGAIILPDVHQVSDPIDLENI